MAWILCLGFLWCNYFLSVELSNIYGGYDKMHVNGYIFLVCKTLLCFLLETWNFLLLIIWSLLLTNWLWKTAMRCYSKSFFFFLLLKHYDISTFLDCHCQVKSKKDYIVNSWVCCLENNQLVITSGFSTVNFRKW